MKRFRLSTLMLLIVIAALVVALVRERGRSARLERQVPRAINMNIKSSKYVHVNAAELAPPAPKEGAEK